MPNAPSNSNAAASGRLKWRCRRGVRELDVLLSQFVEERYPHLNAGQRRAFEQLLDCPDPDIMDWLYARREVEHAELSPIVAMLRRCSRAADTA